MAADERIFSGGELIEFHLGEITGLHAQWERYLSSMYWNFASNSEELFRSVCPIEILLAVYFGPGCPVNKHALFAYIHHFEKQMMDI